MCPMIWSSFFFSLTCTTKRTCQNCSVKHHLWYHYFICDILLFPIETFKGRMLNENASHSNSRYFAWLVPFSHDRAPNTAIWHRFPALLHVNLITKSISDEPKDRLCANVDKHTVALPCGICNIWTQQANACKQKVSSFSCTDITSIWQLIYTKEFAQAYRPIQSFCGMCSLSFSLILSKHICSSFLVLIPL